MGITAIREVRNHSTSTATIQSRESGAAAQVGPGARHEFKEPVHIPWCTSASEFGGHHIVVTVGNRTFTVWQADRGGADLVRASFGAWQDPGEPIGGVAAVGPFPPIYNPLRPREGERTLVINDSGCFMLPQELIDQIAFVRQSAPAYRICDVAPHPIGNIPSVPKKSSIAFSMAGPSSDAYDRREATARFRYRDSGKRYEFRIENGEVQFQPPVQGLTRLNRFVSYARQRAGDVIGAPALDLVASSGGRVFAKEQGHDRFYMARLDEMYIHARGDGREFAVPPTYFKIDPEVNQPQVALWPLLAHLAGDFSGHPAGERFTTFRVALDSGLLGGMIVRFDRCTWHLLDPRPPTELAPDEGPEIPPWAPSYPHVRYCVNAGDPGVWRPSVDYVRVLDIGVGHVHHHDQYESITGGELQPLRATAGNVSNASAGYLPKSSLPLVWSWLVPGLAGVFPWDEAKTYADGYRLFNGPVRDGDGFVDGTCNYYILVQLKRDESITADPQTRRDAYALLYLDEQILFTKRWRLVHPDDYRNTMFTLVKDLNADLHRDPTQKVYNWNPSTYWCPFRAGHVGPRSRLAVAAQVLLVNGEDPTGEAAIYSINFSFSTMDRSWRWRRLPAPARYFDGQSLWNPPAVTIAGDERVPDGLDACAYPQTIRLREDMTICLQGRSAGSDGRVVVGWWYQRYLPADNQLVPHAAQLVAGQRPTRSYEHRWKFLPQAVFQRADQYSHFGVYDQVDSRTQYYTATPASDVDAQTLSGQPGPWIDADPKQHQLSIDAQRFPWDTLRIRHVATPLTPLNPFLFVVDLLGHPLHWAPQAEQGPVGSLLNHRARLRIVKRGNRWIAMHWDKRDDDLLPYKQLGVPIVLTNESGSRAQVTLSSNRWIEQPPRVPVAYVWWESADTIAVAFVTGWAPVFDHVWRVRMAAFVDPAVSTQVVSLLDVVTAGTFVPIADGVYKYRWIVPAADQERVRAYASRAGALQYGTSVWFEDVVGHVAVPQEIRWQQSPTLAVSVTRLAIPLGARVELTVSARDAAASAAVPGTVNVDGTAVAPTDRPFSHIFTKQVHEEFDPEIRRTIRTFLDPSATVTADGYAETPIPFTFYESRATFVRQSVPSTMVTGRRYPVSVTMRNSGTGVWQRESPTPFRLGSQNVQDNVTWGLRRCDLAGAVSPGQEATFTFYVTAPAPGTHAFQWQMLEESVQWFGALSPNVLVTVSPVRMRTIVQPSPIPTGRYVDVVVRAEDAETGVAVAGTVKITGYPAAPTGAPIRVFFGGSPPAGVVSAPGYPDAPILWPPLTTYSVRFLNASGGIGGAQI